MPGIGSSRTYIIGSYDGMTGVSERLDEVRKVLVQVKIGHRVVRS